MKTSDFVIVAVVLLGLSSAALAEDSQLSSRSAGKLRQDQSVDLSAVLEQKAPLSRARTDADESYVGSGAGADRAGRCRRRDLSARSEVGVKMLS